MPSLHDLAIDLINDAKGAKNVAAKLYNLEQIKEIAFHRDTSILSEIAPEIINNFMVERSSSIRRFLVSFAADWLLLDFSAAIPLSLSLFGFLLASESGDGPLRQISTELTITYDRIVMHITGLPIKSRTSGPNVADPKSYWGSLRTIVSRLIDMISSDRSEQLRAQSLKLAENMILFGLPPEKLSSDPRLAKSRPQAGDTSKGLSAGDIPLHHTFINRNDLEQEAESIFSKMLLWASKGGPQGHPFSAAQMALLGGSIANIASVRPKKNTNAATALVQVLQGKGSLCHLLTKEERDNLARCIQKLLRATYASPDPDGLMGKLRTALDGLMALATVAAESAETTAGMKRPASEIDEDLDDPGSLDLRASAIAAVDAAENSIKTKTPRIETAVTPGLPGVHVTGSVPGAASSIGPTSVDTELSAELSSFPEGVTGIKLVSLQAATAVTDVTSVISPAASGIVSSSGLIIRPTPTASDSYSDLALLSMKRILSTFSDVRNFGTKASEAHTKLSVRMVTTMSLLDLAESKSSVRVPLFSSLSPAAAGALMRNVPADVNLPRCLWAVLGYILIGNLSIKSSQKASTEKGLCAESVQLLTLILTELHHRIKTGKKYQRETVASSSNTDIAESSILENLYNDACIAVLARLLQGVETRTAAKDVMLGLPRVPTCCLSLLRLLVHTGTRAIAPPPGVRRDAQGPRNRGTRTEALSLLGQMVFCADEKVGISSLYHLLWCAVTDDFEVRSKAVAMIIGDVIPEDEGVFQSVTLFAVHSVIAVVGQDKIVKRIQTLAQYQHEIELQLQLQVEERNAGAVDEAIIHDSSVPMSGTEASSSSSSEGLRGDEDFMEVGGEGEGEGEGEGQEEEMELKLSIVVDTYDGGSCFEGAFTDCKSFSGALASSVTDKTVFQVKKSVQLLSQLCLVKPSLLTLLFGIYSTAAACHKEAVNEWNSSSSGAQVIDVTSTTAAATATATSSAATASDVTATKGTITSKYSVICDVIQSEISSITPAIAKHLDAQAMFYMFTTKDSDPYMRPLLEICLQITHSDPSVPASSALIEAVKSYLKTPLFLRSVTGYEQHLEYEKELILNANTDVSKGSTATSVFESNKSIATLKIYFPLLGGFTAAELTDILPKLLGTFSDEPEVLKDAFKKIYSARPPPLSRAALFAALHRIDCESSGLKQKILLDVISLCLGSKDEFRSEVIREAISGLLDDPVPAQALMRTAILSGQSYGNEMKKFILSDVMPSLIRKKVWNSAPKVWDGVSHGVKIFSEHKSAEPTLRCLLGLPGVQLKSILKVAPKVKPLLASLLKALSAEEKEECISGRFAGLISDVTDPVVEAVVDTEKNKILKELSLLG